MKKINFKKPLSRATALLVAVLSMAMLTPGIMQWAHAITAPRAQISFTFDDGLASHYNLAAPALQRQGYTGTAYVTTDCVGMTTVPNTCKADEQKAYMTWQQVKDLKSLYGWEIGSHTKTHPLLDSASAEVGQEIPLTDAQITDELALSKKAIIDNAGITPTSFASPFGDYTPSGQRVITEIAKYYTSHRGFHDYGYNYFPYNNYLLADLPVQSGAVLRGDPATLHVDVARVKTYIDEAYANGRWLVLTFHDITQPGAQLTGPDDYDFPVDQLEEIAAYAKSKGIVNANVSDGLVTNPGGGNMLTNSSFNTPVTPATTTSAPAATATWTTDDLANIKQDTTNRGNIPDSTNTVSLLSGATNTHLFSNAVKVEPKPYVIQMYLNTVQILTSGEIGFYVEEYDATGAPLAAATQYRGSFYGGVARDPAAPTVLTANNPLVRTFGFEYTPSAGAVSARLQVVLKANSGLVSYLDNIQWFAQDGSTKNVSNGDVNGDGLVNGADLSTVLTNWNKTSMTLATGDVNGDGLVNGADLSTVLTNWSK